ncbi:Uncharacterised protein [Legionella donaldsonii]|uniref:Uncharacterized protein n=1 Tax=Legionella donaldsonii TaxID=45060 RepID=A0A378J2K8_9GAMM|nr:hypothetical protein [Legionella donaldsonii]STX41201.1 Uncharacterised protein [Legionella donaldsonii]
MPGFFDRAKQAIVNKSLGKKEPDAKQNPVENYVDHAHFLLIKSLQKFDTLKEKYGKLEKDGTEASFYDLLSFIKKEANKHLTICEKLRDGHDYFDEVVGATAIPALGMIASTAALGMAIWEGAQALAIHAGFKEGTDKEKSAHLENAGTMLLASAAAFVGAVASFLKSAISLVTRPVVTAIEGFAAQDKDRFYDKSSIAAKL